MWGANASGSASRQTFMKKHRFDKFLTDDITLRRTDKCLSSAYLPVKRLCYLTVAITIRDGQVNPVQIEQN